MVLTAAQTTAFFEQDAQMAMLHETVVQLANEGITVVSDLVDFDKVDYKKDEATAVAKADMYVVTRRGGKRLRKTTCGWKLLIKWKDDTESWIPLKDLKESHPVEVAEFAKARGIADEPAFMWWVPYTLRKRDIILSAVKSRIRKTTHKYGIEIPTSIEHAYKIDERNQNTFWRDAIVTARCFITEIYCRITNSKNGIRIET